jgi:hypothetical protein
VGELDPRIRIRAPLRCDGIGRLDCAEDTVSGERLAVRWLPLDANGELAVKACEKLPAHHALPRILQTGQVGGSAFVALDFPDGEMLSARGEERLENELLLKLAACLADALATVHAQGVVHGEMSRDSVLLTREGKASLWDMPLVIANRLADRRGEGRLMQNLVKTAPYLSPERARGEGASQEGDVYALGVILCISGGAPAPSASTTLGMVHQIAAGQWTPRVPTSLPERHQLMISRMVATDPALRPTAAEVATGFSQLPQPSALPTVPELQAVRLPPEILAAADALMKQQVEAMRAPTREMPLAQVAAALEEVRPAALPLADDPLPQLELKAPQVQAHTLDPVGENEPEVVRIPTIELQAVTAEALAAPAAAPVVEAAPVAPSVQLTDAVSVSAELMADGAVQLSADEVAAARNDERKLLIALSALGGSILAVITVLIVSFTQQAPAPVVVPSTVKLEAAAPAPVKASAPLDELTPLTRIAAPKAAPKPVAPKVEAAAVAAPAPAPAAVEPEPAPVADVPASRPHDFEFLDSTAEAPKSELKRPTSEL